MDADTDFEIYADPSIVLLTPLSDRADDWASENIAEPMVMFGLSYPIEARFFPTILAGIVDAGMTCADA